MDMLQSLREKNPHLALFDVRDEAFAEYGVVLDGYDTAEICSAASKLEMPEEGSLYLPSVEAFESLEIAKKIGEDIFGTLPAQIGYCYGHSNALNGLEWHCCSELNIAVTPLVLMLAKRSDIQSGRVHSSCVKTFFVPAGTVIEVFATTLHFCPCEVSADGFGCVVGLLKGTNLPHESEREDKLMFRQNKWLLVHTDNAGLIARGCVPGIDGENYELLY